MRLRVTAPARAVRQRKPGQPRPGRVVHPQRPAGDVAAHRQVSRRWPAKLPYAPSPHTVSAALPRFAAGAAVVNVVTWNSLPASSFRSFTACAVRARRCPLCDPLRQRGNPLLLVGAGLGTHGGGNATAANPRVRSRDTRALRSRSSTAPSACSHAMRPNRPSHARGMGSLLAIFPVACASASCAPTALRRCSANVSSPSSCASSSTAHRDRVSPFLRVRT